MPLGELCAVHGDPTTTVTGSSSNQRMTAGKFTVALGAVAISMATQPSASFRSAPAVELMLPSSLDCWEPAIAVGPREQVYIVAGQRRGSSQSTEFDQQLVIWRSIDGGTTFEGPWIIDAAGHRQGDQRIGTARDGAIYVSYMDHENLNPGAPTRLRLARSRDQGRTFSVDTIPVTRVSDKPELAVSPDGHRIAVVYESTPGPAIVTSTDGGKTWNDARLIEPADGRHFWPEALTIAPDGALWLAVPSMSDADIIKRVQTDVQLHVFRSTDDGRRWQDHGVSVSPRFLKGCVHDPDCRVRLPSIGIGIDGTGRIHAAFTEGSGPGHPYALLLKSSSDAGGTWSASRPVSTARRPSSNDEADHDFPAVASDGQAGVCVVWVDDRRGALDMFARCSGDAAKTWGDDVLLSNRSEGMPYKSPLGFASIYGHYGGAAISSGGRLFAVWAEGDRGNRTGSVWFNSIKLAR